jgi:hypothetical protein
VPGRDGVVVVQAKVIAAPVFRAHWIDDDGDDDSDDVEFAPATPPLAYQLQTLTEAMLADAAAGVLAVLVVDTFKWKLRLFWVERHLSAESRIREKVAHFWSHYLDLGIQPPIDAERDEELVKALFPTDDGTEIDLTGDNEIPGLVDALETARAEKKRYADDEQRAKTAIAAKMGDAAIAHIAGGRRITFKTVHKKGYAVPAMSFRAMKVINGDANSNSHDPRTGEVTESAKTDIPPPSQTSSPRPGLRRTRPPPTDPPSRRGRPQSRYPKPRRSTWSLRGHGLPRPTQLTPRTNVRPAKGTSATMPM